MFILLTSDNMFIKDLNIFTLDIFITSTSDKNNLRLGTVWSKRNLRLGTAWSKRKLRLGTAWT